MELLLTSAGTKNTSIANALVEMLGKPIAEATALVIPTAAYPAGGPAAAWRIVSGLAMTPLCEIGWKSLGLRELTALPSIDAAQWIPVVREIDAHMLGPGSPIRSNRPDGPSDAGLSSCPAPCPSPPRRPPGR